MTQKKNLPKLADLHHAPESAERHERFIQLMNHTPRKEWLTQHPLLKVKVNGQNVPVMYLPIAKVEDLLDKIFQQYRIEVLNTAQLFNSVAVTVRVNYKHPLTGEWEFHDGVGAVGVQTDKGASASDLGAIKQDAIMKALPAAKSYAIKDAAHHLGRLFGRDLNREYYELAQEIYTKSNEPDARERGRLFLWMENENRTIADLTDFADSEAFVRYQGDAAVMAVFNKKMSQL